MTDKKSFQLYLKNALKTYIYEKELNEATKSKKSIPFMIIGLKKDNIEKIQVDNDEVLDLIRTLKNYQDCELLQVSNFESDDILASLLNLFGLANDTYFSHNRNKKFQEYNKQ